MASAAKTIINKVITGVGAYPGETMILGTGATIATTYGVISTDEGEFDFELLDEIGYGEYEIPRIWRTSLIDDGKRIKLSQAKKPPVNEQYKIAKARAGETPKTKMETLMESKIWSPLPDAWYIKNNNPYYSYTRMYGDNGPLTIPTISSSGKTVDQINDEVFAWCKKSLPEPATDMENLEIVAKWCSTRLSVYSAKVVKNGQKIDVVKRSRDEFKDSDYDDLMDDPLLPHEDARWLEGVINEKSGLDNRKDVIHRWCTLKGMYTFWREEGSGDFDLVWRYCYSGYDRKTEPKNDGKDSYQKVVERMVGTSMDDILGKKSYLY